MRPGPRLDQPDQYQGLDYKTKIKTKTGEVLNHSPVSACRIRQCDKLRQVVQLKVKVKSTCRYILLVWDRSCNRVYWLIV